MYFGLVWVVSEITSLSPRTGKVVGIFDNKKKADKYAFEKFKEGKIISTVGWCMNEKIPIGREGIV